METVIETYSAEETRSTAAAIAAKARPQTVFALQGDLGVGKTVFSQGFAEGLGVTEPVSSPTFTILQEYTDGRMPFYHFDVYRIEEPEEMEEVGLDDYLYGEGVCMIEWPERIEELLPEETVWIRIEKDLSKGTDYRRISVSDSEQM